MEISPYKIKWSFIFCNFLYAKDRAAFKAKLKRAGICCDYLNNHNLLITNSGYERAFIFKNQPSKSTFQELRVTDKQFGLMKLFSKI